MKLLPILSLLTLSATLFAQTPEQIFDAKCTMCHIKTRPQDSSTLIAPPIMGVMRHMKMELGSKQKVVAFISDYVLNPSKEKALCRPQKVEHFGVMPSQKGNITKEELQQVASWLYDTYPSRNFKGGMMQGKGMMQGRGMMNN